MATSKRTSNYTTFEKEVLVTIVDKYKCILENKSTSAQMINEKSASWEKVTNEFNSRSNVDFRSCKQLKQFWKNEKAKARAYVSEMRRTRKATGDVPRRPELTNITEKTDDSIHSCRIPSSSLSSSERSRTPPPSTKSYTSQTPIPSQSPLASTSYHVSSSPSDLPPSDLPPMTVSALQAVEYMDFLKELAEKEHLAKMENYRLKRILLTTKIETAKIKKQKTENNVG